MGSATTTSNSAQRPAPHDRPPTFTAAAFVFAALAFAGLLVAFWWIAKRYAMEVRVGGHMPSAFATFAMLLAPYWFFAFGLADPLTRILRSRAARVLTPGILVLPYVVFSVPRSEFRTMYVVIFAAAPIVLAAIFEFVPPPDDGFSWQDGFVLIVVGVPIEFGVLRGAFPHPGLGVLPKFLLMDALLYAYLVVRRLPGIGYDLRLRARDFMVGVREWGLFAPIAIMLGLAIGFIKFHAYLPDAANVLSAWAITFFFVALPEEFFFRGLLQNLLERRFAASYAQDAKRGLAARRAALLIASVIFGLSHFNKPLPFNWRYVLLATIAGVFYGRAWLDRRRLGTSSITHATVDVVWGTWFHL